MNNKYSVNNKDSIFNNVWRYFGGFTVIVIFEFWPQVQKATISGLSLYLLVKGVDRLGYGAGVIAGANTRSRGYF
jgi:hypothetical protein